MSVDRRGFLQLLLGAGIAATLPEVEALAEAAAPIRLPGTNVGFAFLPPQSPFIRSCSYFDYEHMMGAMVALNHDGRDYRRAVKLPTAAWKYLTNEQKEHTWRMLETDVMQRAGLKLDLETFRLVKA